VVVVPAVSTRPALEERVPRVLAIDRQELFLAAIERVLARPELAAEVVTITRTDAAVELLVKQSFDLVICECRSTPDSGPTLVSKLAASMPLLRVILVGEPGDEQQLVDAFKAGAAGIFTKRSLSAEFVEGAVTVLAGHRVVAGELVRYVLTTADPPSPRSDWTSVLSPAEVGILTMLGEARSIAFIAAARGSSQKTVRNHVATIYRKMGLKNRIEAVLCAARIGLVHEER